MIAQELVNADVRPLVGMYQVSNADCDLFEPVVLQVFSNSAPDVAQLESAHAVSVIGSNGSVMLKPHTPHFYSIGARVCGFYKTDKFISLGLGMHPVMAYSGVWHTPSIDYLSGVRVAAHPSQFFTNELARLPEGEYCSEGVASTVSFNNTQHSLETITASIQGSKLLPTMSPEFDQLLNKVVSMQGAPHDIDKWAKQLAEDTGDLVD